jgi:hypothetical protein
VSVAARHRSKSSAGWRPATVREISSQRHDGISTSTANVIGTMSQPPGPTRPGSGARGSAGGLVDRRGSRCPGAVRRERPLQYHCK